ncbi:Rrf2 family transcriptional regulator [Epibacterium sp. Ofav1-8]|uniref:Rrf2 family transcriptional regulator n=1 Tax=Epibacterium sp. Ofav1-8 TaxID=2917735 RepID=UPI001EF48F0F|nr:Rrf2 family transcriptional regulator [Epibacterium sp. Ofav1-8]MCG7625074.1 Rrf2 family transcriptional regulator [Epibacterium sp. Ofav1-8]
MRTDSRLPRVLHALLHMAEMDRPATSEEIAAMLGTNATVVRRTLAGLREAQLLTSTKGHGGGWSLSRPLTEISLLDLYSALGAPELFAIAPDEDQPSCLLARAANAATNDALYEAKQVFKARLAARTVAEIVKPDQSIVEPFKG